MLARLLPAARGAGKALEASQLGELTLLPQISCCAAGAGGQTALPGAASSCSQRSPAGRRRADSFDAQAFRRASQQLLQEHEELLEKDQIIQHLAEQLSTAERASQQHLHRHTELLEQGRTTFQHMAQQLARAERKIFRLQKELQELKRVCLQETSAFQRQGALQEPANRQQRTEATQRTEELQQQVAQLQQENAFLRQQLQEREQQVPERALQMAQGPGMKALRAQKAGAARGRTSCPGAAQGLLQPSVPLASWAAWKAAWAGQGRGREGTVPGAEAEGPGCCSRPRGAERSSGPWLQQLPEGDRLRECLLCWGSAGSLSS